ncbi:MAG: hypothetical protein E3K32_12960 [wastewater metagenome]|nr:hypothetical protein [Candidatus Loosdrechtia aerotolerans]
MDKELLKKIIGNPKFIPGIYNYCDRWCKRCSFTSRCANYALSEEQFTDLESHDINSKVFWQNMNTISELTLEILREIAGQEGIDLDTFAFKIEPVKKSSWKEMAENHECSRAARVYGDMTENWFTSAEESFIEKENELNLKMHLEVPDTNPVAEMNSLNDIIEVIHWYQHQIYVKIVRAIRGDMEERPEVPDGFPRDSDGSAKVALIGIDRSIAAWGKMWEHFPERKDDTLDLLVHLDRLRRKIEQVFPSARVFVRPGFDETNP